MRGRARQFVSAIAGALFVLSLPAAACLGATAAAESHTTLELRPTDISSNSPTPVSLVFSEQIRRSDGGHVSPPQELTIDLDRRLALDVRGLPSCRTAGPIDNPKYPGEEPCATAKIGSGWIKVDVDFPEQGPFPITARLTVYNGGYYHGVTKLFLRAYLLAPVSGAVVFTAKVHRETEGRFGTRMTVSVPKIAGDGAVTNLRFQLQKGIVTATCPGRRLWAAVAARLADSTVLSNLASSRCTSLHKSP